MQGATESHCCTDNASCQTACVVLVSTTVLCIALCIATSVDCRTGHSKQTLSHCGVPAELVLHSCGFKWMRGGRTRAGWPWPTVAHGGPQWPTVVAVSRDDRIFANSRCAHTVLWLVIIEFQMVCEGVQLCVALSSLKRRAHTLQTWTGFANNSRSERH